MANLPEVTQWEDGIYQIETDDPVLGGQDGIANQQAKQLANRTAFLRGLINAVITQAEIQPSDTDLTQFYEALRALGLRPATDEAAGVVQLADAATAQGLTDAERVLTAATLGAAMNAHVLGMGQTWQDVTAQRAENTVYTNTTGRTIFVSIVRMHSDTHHEVGASITVDGKLVSYIQLDNEGARARSTTQAIVPPGAEYSVTFFGTGTINTTWWELR